ncbi:hypothetical protein IMSAG192_00818 [Muribaculaceae bacterium]|nr:hypothetical protein IMSAG192_00818 [Muribaculaceae bacterium]
MEVIIAQIYRIVKCTSLRLPSKVYIKPVDILVKALAD